MEKLLQEIPVETLRAMALDYGTRLMGALVIFIIGKILARWIASMITKAMVRGKMEATMAGFMENILYFLLLLCVIIASLAKLGIQTASLLAVVGSAGLAVGLALQGSLSNFAAGVLIVMLKPFKLGDYIDGAGTAGTVEKIDIFTTQLKTPDNKTIIIPNSNLTSSNIINFSTQKTRRVDITVGVSYSDDLDHVRKVLEDLANSDSRILQEPAPVVYCTAMADSSVNYVMRMWSKTEDYWPLTFHMNETVKKRLDKEGITIPFPQRELHIHHINQEDKKA